MSYDQNYSGYCSNCGSSGGCNCSGGHEYSACSPDYNPVTVNNSTCPNIDGSTGTGGSGTASGNNSSVHVSVCGPSGCCDEKKDDCCCKDGVKRLLDYLYKRSLDTPTQTSSICIYGDIIPANLVTTPRCSDSPLIYIPTNADIQITSITDDVIKSSGLGTVSLCSMSVIKFYFQTVGTPPTLGVNEDANLRREFFYTPKCKCCCECGDGMAQALYLNGLGNEYIVTLQDTVNEDLTLSKIVQGTLGTSVEPVKLIAIDSDIAIFSKLIGTVNVYYGVPTCRIAKFVQIP